ncbi:MAG: creatininase family protein [Planctomycetia bacterium]|nr:creatininase family protein [Planctomycetia bacterium]
MLLADMKWPEVAALSKDTPVVVPVAALEQHGPHMPVFTDSLLCGEVVRRAHEQFTAKHGAGSVLVAPLQWLGNSEHHIDFCGTLSATPRTYLNLLNETFENLIHHGFRRLVFVNGHGGNDVPGKQAVYELRQRHRSRSDLLLNFATYWLLGGKPYEADTSLVQRQMGHACEWETSMVLRIRPELVGDYKHTIDVPFTPGFEPATRGWIMQDRSTPGHIGLPQHASAEKGEGLFRTFSGDVATLLERMRAWNGKTWDAPAL